MPLEGNAVRIIATYMSCSLLQALYKTAVNMCGCRDSTIKEQCAFMFFLAKLYVEALQLLILLLLILIFPDLNWNNVCSWPVVIFILNLKGENGLCLRVLRQSSVPVNSGSLLSFCFGDRSITLTLVVQVGFIFYPTPLSLL